MSDAEAEDTPSSTQSVPVVVPMRRTGNRRMSEVVDIETGKQGGARLQHALIRHSNSMEACSPGSRRRESFQRNFGLYRRKPASTTDDDVAASSSMHGRLQVSTRGNLRRIRETGSGRSWHGSDRGLGLQFTLQAVTPVPKGNPLWRWLGCSDGRVLSGYEEASGGAFFVNRVVISYLHWAFRSPFAIVFFSAALVFLALTMFFALLIWGIGERHPQCVGGVDFQGDYFTDAFILSWTTFSTVGYGLVYSGISADGDVDDIYHCTGITILVTLEAFVGILFASMCGAIIFAKVARVQSFAQVQWSDPLVIRYGTGVMVNDEFESDSSHDESDVTENKEKAAVANSRIPCPILEFRLINRLHSVMGGEIIDSTINLVASIDATQACPTIRKAATRKRRGKKGKRRMARTQRKSTEKKAVNFRSNYDSDSSNNEAPAENKADTPNSANAVSGSFSKPVPGRRMDSSRSMGTSMNGSSRHLTLRHSRPTHTTFDEDPTGHLVPKRIFSKLELESPDHPFFKRVWMVRHVIDQDSPLLRNHARQMVKANGGFWPQQLNSAEAVRAAIHFDQILVSFSGTSNADANSVYSQKVYDYVDMNIGYRFVNQMYRDLTDGSLRLDRQLINDVVEQAGGGGEDFNAVHGEKLDEMLVL